MKKQTPQDNETRIIPFTRKQYWALLKTVYLGNWVANANRAGGKGDPHKKEYEATEDYIFSFATQFGLEKYMTHTDEDGDKYYPSWDFEEKTDVHKLIDEYDEHAFWDELADNMGERDFYRKYSLQERKAMTRDEHFNKLLECVDAWEEEFGIHDIERLGIVKNI